MSRHASRYAQLTDVGLARLHAMRRRLGLTLDELVRDPETPSVNTIKKALRQEPVFVRTLERLSAYLQRQASQQHLSFSPLREQDDYLYTQDETPEPESEAQAAHGWISRQVPPPNRLFTGRQAVQVQLRAALTAPTPTRVADPQALVGMGGMGKTQTALAYLYAYRHAYRRSFWINAASIEDLNAGLAALAEELGLSQAPLASRQKALERVHAWFRDASEWLLVLDNADDLSQLAPHFPRHHGGHLLLTTRAQNTARWAAAVPLATFAPEEGALLLLRRAGRLGAHESLSQAPATLVAAAQELSQELGGLPLAINQAGAYLAETACSLEEYLQSYRERGLALLDRTGDPDHASVRLTFGLALEQMQSRAVFGAVAVELLLLCAFLQPDAIPEGVLATYQKEHFEAAYAAFLAYSLVSRNPESQTLTIHRLVQLAARELLSPEERAPWRQRAVHAVADATPDFEYEDWPLCEQLLPQWRVCARLIQEDRLQTPQAVHLLYQLGRYLRARASYDEAAGVLDAAITLSEQVHGSVHLTTADVLEECACLCREQDRAQEAEALHLRSLEITETREGVAHPHTAGKLHNMALFYSQKQDFPRAEALFVRALAIWEAHPEVDTLFMAATLTQLAGVYRYQELYTKAEPYSRRALALYESAPTPSPISIATSCHNLGLLCINLGRYSEAEALFLRAQELNEATRGKDHPETGSVLWGLAWCRWKQERYPESDALFRRAVEIYTKSYGKEHSQVTRLVNSYTKFQDETGYRR
jgi:tetratricopeptide (TPR) repeat protein